jgi:hypothetical protein
MPIFSRKQRSDASTTAPDPTFGDPDLAGLRQAMTAGDWRTARALFGRAHDPEDLATFVDLAASVPGSEEWLPEVVRAEIQDTLPLLVYGARGIIWAWEARSAKLARYVSKDQFQLFFERLQVAEDSLQGVVRREPDNVAGWYQLIIVARGLQLGLDEAGRRFEQVVARSPGHVHAHRVMLQQLCLKWGGSHEAMHAFARDAMLRAPAGSPLGELVATAHLEHWIYLMRDKPMNRYLRSKEVLASLHEAADRSVRHPSYRPRRDWPNTHNMFALVFSLAGDRGAAAEQFKVIGDRATEFPWNYLGDPGREFSKRRDGALPGWRPGGS